MKYYRDVDYYLYFLDFPSMGIPGAIFANTNGTVNIYINTLYREEVQKRTIKHELRHLVKNHFYIDTLSIEEKELDADDVDDQSCIFADDFSSVEYIEELDKKQLKQKEDQPRKTHSDVDIRMLPGNPPVFSIFRSIDLPDGASFGFYVPDNSMRPILKKNQLVYCDSQDLRNGDLALFEFKGNTILRQYYQDIFGVYLFALNRKNREDDLFLLPDDLKDLICLGRLMMKKEYPLPALVF